MRKILLFFCLFLFTVLAGAKVDINTAKEKDLEALKGIGPSKAAAIVAYRRDHGPFRFKEEIKMVKGIGDGMYQKIKDDIDLGAQTGRSVVIEGDRKKRKVKRATTPSSDK